MDPIKLLEEIGLLASYMTGEPHLILDDARTRSLARKIANGLLEFGICQEVLPKGEAEKRLDAAKRDYAWALRRVDAAEWFDAATPDERQKVAGCILRSCDLHSKFEELHTHDQAAITVLHFQMEDERLANINF